MTENIPPPLHPNFNLSFTEFNAMFPEVNIDTPQEARRFLHLADRMLELPAHYLLLIDKNHPVPPDYRPKNLRTLSSDVFHVNKDNMRLDNRAYGALLTMSMNAAKAGILLQVSSAYRSDEYQKILFEAYIERFGEEEAVRFSAPPGKSQHQLGTAVDFGDITNSFAETPAGIWLMANAGNYGWSLSYPSEDAEEATGYRWESWHWRWIGAEAAAMQLEFFGDSQQRLLEFWDRHANTLAALRELSSPVSPEPKHPDDTLRHHSP